MDLLGFLGAAHRALSFFGNGPGSDQPWAASEQEFERHFGVPYEAFVEIVRHLDREQEQLLHATLEVNPEAAVLWILAMEEVED
jgi:hypothetical protein